MSIKKVSNSWPVFKLELQVIHIQNGKFRQLQKQNTTRIYAIQWIASVHVKITGTYGKYSSGKVPMNQLDAAFCCHFSLPCKYTGSSMVK